MMNRWPGRVLSKVKMKNIYNQTHKYRAKDLLINAKMTQLLSTQKEKKD